MSRKQQSELGLSFLCHIPLARDGGKAIRTPVEVVSEMAEIRDVSQELFGVLYLNARNRLLDKKIIGIGVVDCCLMDAREVFRPAILSRSVAIVLCHNHPSGDPSPSAEDVRMTRRLIQSGQIIGIKVLDHIILGRTSPERARDYLSLREGGLCEFE